MVEDCGKVYGYLNAGIFDFGYIEPSGREAKPYLYLHEADNVHLRQYLI
jgi:hypothetical protein